MDNLMAKLQLVLVGVIAVATKQEDIVATSTFTSLTYIASIILATPTTIIVVEMPTTTSTITSSTTATLL